MIMPGKPTQRLPYAAIPALIGLGLTLLLSTSAAFAATDPPAATDEVSSSRAATVAGAPAAPAAAPAAIRPSDSYFTRQYMMGNEVARGELAERGVKYDMFYIIDALDNVKSPAGTRQEFNGWGRIRSTIDLDFSKFSRARGLTYHATGLWQYGQNMGGIIGSIANPSGLVSIHTFRLDSMWFQQALVGGKIFLKAGQFATQDFYGIQEYGGSFVMEPLDYAFGNLGNVRASWDPASGPAGEIKVVPSSHFYVKTGWYSGRNYSNTGFNYRKVASSTLNGEIGLQTFVNPAANSKRYSGVVKVGTIYNGGKFFDYEKNANVSGNYTIYAQAAQPVYRMDPGSNRGLDITAGVNTGPAAKSEVPTEFTMGATFNGPLNIRKQDSVSFGLVYSKISDKYNNSVATKLSDEKAYEFNYKAQIAPWLMLQPVYQYFGNVGGRQNGAAGVVGFRLKTTF